MALSDEHIRKAIAKAKPYKLTDGKGLFLLVTPRGSRLWRFKYRFDGKEKQLALGIYPKVSILDARMLRDDARRLLEQGIDPSSVRKAQKQRESAARHAGEGLPSVRINMGGEVEIRKGRDVMRLTSDEAQFVKDILIKIG